MIREFDRVSPDAVVILVSNPVDVLTPIAIETSTRPARLLMGSGTVLDTGARLRHRLGTLLGVEKEDVHVYVVGEHGDSSFPVWSSAAVGVIGLEDYRLPESTSLSQLEHALTTATRRRGMNIPRSEGIRATASRAPSLASCEPWCGTRSGYSWSPSRPPTSTA